MSEPHRTIIAALQATAGSEDVVRHKFISLMRRVKVVLPDLHETGKEQMIMMSAFSDLPSNTIPSQHQVGFLDSFDFDWEGHSFKPHKQFDQYIWTFLKVAHKVIQNHRADDLHPGFREMLAKHEVSPALILAVVAYFMVHEDLIVELIRNALPVAHANLQALIFLVKNPVAGTPPIVRSPKDQAHWRPSINEMKPALFIALQTYQLWVPLRTVHVDSQTQPFFRAGSEKQTHQLENFSRSFLSKEAQQVSTYVIHGSTPSDRDRKNVFPTWVSDFWSTTSLNAVFKSRSFGKLFKQIQVDEHKRLREPFSQCGMLAYVAARILYANKDAEEGLLPQELYEKIVPSPDSIHPSLRQYAGVSRNVPACEMIDFSDWNDMAAVRQAEVVIVLILYIKSFNHEALFKAGMSSLCNSLQQDVLEYNWHHDIAANVFSYIADYKQFFEARVAQSQSNTVASLSNRQQRVYKMTNEEFKELWHI
ncbi:hypothetical protein OIO90_004324 [Microbotryomycetes sp. JL221]|nr:hypothetical protein OIO90_004324 [Microbotryomycetes sp. JL221]